MSENTSLEVRDIEKRELNHIVTSYEENRNELLDRVPELIDWDMFRRKVSPEMVDVLQMQHKRLKKLGVQLKTQEEDMSKGWVRGRLYYLQTVSSFQDGPYTIGVLKKKRKRIREYYREKQMLCKFKDKAWFSYFVRQEPEERKVISSEDMTFKALGNYTREIEFQPESYFKEQNSMLVWLLYTPWVIMISAVDVLRYTLGGMMTTVFPFLQGDIVAIVPTIIVVGIECALTVSIIKLFQNWRCRVKSHKVLQKIRQQWPNFCMEKFISMASNRLKCIFYADSMAEIGDFVSCDLTNALVDYANVVDCETIDFRFKKMSQDENYYYIDVRQKVLLTGDLGTKIKRKKLTVKLRFMRPKDSIMSMDFYRDWYIGEMKVGRKWFGTKKVEDGE